MTREEIARDRAQVAERLTVLAEQLESASATLFELVSELRQSSSLEVAKLEQELER